MIVAALVEKLGPSGAELDGQSIKQAGLTIKIDYDDDGHNCDGGEDEIA